MIQATEGIGTQWLLDLCNGIVKGDCIPEDWKSSVILPIYKGKGDPIECGSYREIKLLEHAMILQQNRLRWYGHVLRKEDTDWVKKCMEYEVSRYQTKR